jgi:hypothetical protein
MGRRGESSQEDGSRGVESKEKRVKRRRRRGPVLYAGVVGRKMVEQYGGELDSVVQVRQISRSRQGRSRVKAGGWRLEPRSTSVCERVSYMCVCVRERERVRVR